MKRRLISVFTPSNTDPELLERIFVQRQRLLEKIVDRLARSMLTGDKHHALLIGPRGSGKTNMVTLAHHRLSQQSELTDAMRVAWLGEDDTITGLIDLVLAIADQLSEKYPSEFAADYREQVRGLPPDDAAESVLIELHRRLQHRALLLIVENLDAAFKGMGDLGQKRWRAFLQEKGGIATLATSQQIFDGVSDRDYPFWGFFDIHHLAPLSFEDVRLLIRKIALENESHELTRYLETTEGQDRIRSLHYLAGGNHRMYVTLSEFLNKESLDELVNAFEILADELTPYFQERIRSLPAQQARIVQCLAAESGATTVKEVAALTLIDERSCSKQLGELRIKRYVQSEKRGKESYYELAEPLMRLCLEFKRQRGKPLQLVVNFLRAWFSTADLQMKLDKKLSDDDRSAEVYLRSALNSAIETQVQVREKASNALHSTNESIGNEMLQSLWKTATEKWESGDYVAAYADYMTIVEMKDAPKELKAHAYFYLGTIQLQSEKTHEALSSFRAAEQLAPKNSSLRCSAMFALTAPLVDVGLLDEVYTALRRAFESNKPTCEGYGSTPVHLFAMVLRRGSRDWEKYVAKLMTLYVEFGAVDQLAHALTLLIQRLDDGDLSHGQLDEWNSVWQRNGANIEELEIAIKCLSAATEAIKAKSDRPLFQLPREIRSLVRPLLKHSLGPILDA